MKKNQGISLTIISAISCVVIALLLVLIAVSMKEINVWYNILLIFSAGFLLLGWYLGINRPLKKK